MDVTARLRRIAGWIVAFLVLAVLAACSARTISSSTASTEDTATAAVTEQQIADSSNTNNWTAPDTAPSTSYERLASANGGNLGLGIVNGDGFARLVIEGRELTNNYTLTRLENPARVVVDLPAAASTSSFTAPTSNSNIVSQVRVGAHPDKTRLVLDLRDPSVEQQAAMQQDRLVITMAQPSALQTALAAPIEDNSKIALNDDAHAAFPADTETATTGSGVTAAQPEIAAAKNNSKLTGLSIEELAGSGPSLVAETTGTTGYNLSKTAPSEFVLTLPNTGLEASAANTILAPRSTSGAPQIRSVRPVVEGDNVMVRIFTTPGISLDATSNGNRIVVTPRNAPGTSDIRAQMAEEKKADADKPADAAAGEQVKVSDVQPAAPSDDELSSLLAETPKYNGRLISLDLQDTDIDNALRIIAEVSNLNIIASDDVTGKVTLRLIDVPWDQALDVILKTNGLDKVQEGNVIRIAPVEKLRLEREALKQAKEAETQLAPLTVKYVRVSYAKASDLKPLVESVITERGTVAYDERTNQLIIKDIEEGIKNVAQLVAKIDLRTPQVLLETQIVEAQRSLARALGTELGFEYIRSPETGNATGYNFPNSVNVGGSVSPGSNVASSFPVAIGASGGSAVNFLFDSADGTKALDARISALENEGRIRVISRPSVATTNNKSATIKSVEKIRVKTPDGGLSVATGQGASAAGTSTVATEVIEIGITLEVTPQASPDYYVLLDIDAKSSTFGSHEVDGIPSEVERSANSTVLVASGQTFAMGGIYKISDNDNISGVPFLKDIPFLGHLFRRASVDNSDEELIFFITPRIIEGSFDDAAMKSAS
ncbi:MAG: type IV pilus secretin PilQ [Oligoflexia bacterium]|nr:type IV pilus secretin PilQ [Oligoflexia bacterium]